MGIVWVIVLSTSLCAEQSGERNPLKNFPWIEKILKAYISFHSIWIGYAGFTIFYLLTHTDFFYLSSLISPGQDFFTKDTQDWIIILFLCLLNTMLTWTFIYTMVFLVIHSFVPALLLLHFLKFSRYLGTLNIYKVLGVNSVGLKPLFNSSYKFFMIWGNKLVITAYHRFRQTIRWKGLNSGFRKCNFHWVLRLRHI